MGRGSILERGEAPLKLPFNRFFFKREEASPLFDSL